MMCSVCATSTPMESICWATPRVDCFLGPSCRRSQIIVFTISSLSAHHRLANMEVSIHTKSKSTLKLICENLPSAAFLHLIFPNLASRTAFEIFYSRVGQHTSVGNYWNDPHRQELFYKYSNFLPYVNNEILTGNSTGFRNGLLKLNKMVLIGGPDDGVITPWQSSHFGYFDKNEDVVNVFDRPIYLNDSIGLKSLNDSGRLEFVTVPNVKHYDWHLKLHVIQQVVLPFLD